MEKCKSFLITTVSVPTAIWLFGAGILSLLSFARRR